MKKFTTLALVSLLAACTQTTSSTSTQTVVQENTVTMKNFVGNWACKMDGDKVASNNKVKLAEDGFADYHGTIALPAGKPAFHYDLQRVGTWDYQNEVLSYHFTQNKVTRAHSEKTTQAMKSSKQLRDTEKQYFDAINKQLAQAGKSKQDVSLKVSNFSGQSFALQQMLEKGSRTGHCVRNS
ncbi:hypothetical protein BMT54_00105 [Pasteurellaceae bacterium 15-036681]|nr:hypothetical protein BMT54_00105 [Pasteurellaceae bacterium 15-036681]